ncbi:MAG: hypothetical protein ABI406_18120 [Ktedonobacteraceae bacterium]
MQHRVLSLSSLSLWVRLLIAFALGLLLGITAFTSASDALLQWVPIVVLLFAMMVSITFDERVVKRHISTSRIVYGCAMVLLAMVVVFLVVSFLLGIVPSFSFLTTLLIALELGIGVGFAVGNEENGASNLSGLVAWAGTAMLLLIATGIQARIPGSKLGAVYSTIVTVAVIGLGFAVLGGLLGRYLRIWIMRRVVGEDEEES